MIGGHFFKRLRDRRGTPKTTVQPNTETLLELVSRCVVEPFARVTDMSALAIPVVSAGPEEVEDPPPNPGHPACAQYADSDYCRESWQLHLAELRRRPETHWHTCNHDMICALVPVVHHDRCLAVIQLACLASMAEGGFEDHVRLLDSLAKNFVVSKADFLGRLLRAEQAAADSGPPPSHDGRGLLEQQPDHPQVVRALEYVEKHLTDPKLSVGHVARELDIDPSYLGRLFAYQVGQRMSWFIAGQRVELAKTLLATTNWQIKRIAFETGYANANWFCHVFGVHAGLTPGGYRRRSRRQSLAASDR